MSVLIVTSLGDIVIDLYTDRCPLTTKNFLKLCRIKYYNGCLFHTVQKDFTAQTGDPTGTGTGGDSVYKFLYGDQARFFGDEIHPMLKHSKTGTVAMASAGENLNASQFYFTLRDDLDYLDGKHTVFGEVAEGLDTLTRINEAYVDDKGRPFKNIRIKHTYILDDPFDDPVQLAELIPESSPEGKPAEELEDVRLEDDWVPIDEKLGPAELEEVLRVKEAQSNAVFLETVGDIPDAEIKPPENVLFVCKLNPVTQDEDLDTIFSRFGNVLSSEVIRDYKTGDSLCYAFIEFETQEACERAYFKMDNALIDDRRIHVDFSQSVAKLWSQYRRRKGNQSGRGKGCYKCGSIDHVAKDCSEGTHNKSVHPKYVLKDENLQHGGESYDLVFDGDMLGTEDDNKKCKEDGRRSKDSFHRDHGRIDSTSERRRRDESRAQSQEERISGNRGIGRERHHGRNAAKDSAIERRGDGHGSKKDENHKSNDRDERKRTDDDNSYRRGQQNDVYRIKDKDSHKWDERCQKKRKNDQEGGEIVEYDMNKKRSKGHERDDYGDDKKGSKDCNNNSRRRHVSDTKRSSEHDGDSRNERNGRSAHDSYTQRSSLREDRIAHDNGDNRNQDDRYAHRDVDSRRSDGRDDGKRGRDSNRDIRGEDACDYKRRSRHSSQHDLKYGHER